MKNLITPPLRPPQIELTTRDHLAFDILKVLLSSSHFKPSCAENYARDAYDVVDEMLKARDI